MEFIIPKKPQGKLPEGATVHGKNIPRDREVTLSLVGDSHIGFRGFHEAAYKAVLDRVEDEKDHFLIHMGDLCEARAMKHKFFEAECAAPWVTSVASMYHHARRLHDRPAAQKIVVALAGNHDDSSDNRQYANFVKDLFCEPLGIPYGGYLCHLDLGNGVRGHLWHGGPAMPRGAKDPIQRDANQRAWLVNRTHELASDVHFHAMGHVHYLLQQEPLPHNLFGHHAGRGGLRSRSAVLPGVTVEGIDYVPPLSRWYFATGSFMRSGGVGWSSYAERAGYPPTNPGFIEMKMKGGRITWARKCWV